MLFIALSRYGFHRLAPVDGRNSRKAQNRAEHKCAGIVRHKAGQQVNQVEARLHPQCLGGVGADIVFQPEQDVDVPHQHIQRSVEEKQRHQLDAVFAKAKSSCKRFCKKQRSDTANDRHDQHRKPGTGGEHSAPGHALRRLAVKAQQTLVKPKHPHIH